MKISNSKMTLCLEEWKLSVILGDLLSSGDCKHAVIARLSKAWNKFRRTETTFVC
jgi:hypothetical protein